MRSFFLFLLMILACSACQLFFPDKDREKTERKKIARVGEDFLYEDDLESITSGASSSSDSVDLANRYIQSWVRNELLLGKAEESVDFNMDEINRKVNDYRYALMVFEFKKKFLNQNLDTSISEEEIKAYYDSHLDNFLLKQNIIRGRYFQASKEAPKLEEARSWVKSDEEDEIENLKSFCIQFATSYNLQDTTWINFEDIILNTPFQSIPNKVQFLQNNRFAEASDSLFQYTIFIKNYKIQDQLSPLEFVRDQIVQILINKRKVELSEKLEDQILLEARQNSSFEIY